MISPLTPPRVPQVPPQVVSMTNKFGQKYRCLLPDLSDLQQMHSHAREKENGQPANQEEAAETFVEEIKRLLSPLGRSANCLFYTKDWWTYEFCYGQTVRQYHMEGKSARKSFLGRSGGTGVCTVDKCPTLTVEEARPNRIACL